MLILTRKPGESVIIRHPAGDIQVTHLSTFNDKARLGFDAPNDVQIVRTEILDQYPDRDK
jgi:carbon storage regulator CsrA